uniref:G-protein coupled receptors family 1 profile domain-containing protein n=1 Tax=Romanomermis culicivorax TaxID=13658 RepID=A0A915K2K6_ROMCU
MNFTYFLPFCKSKSAATEDLMGQVEKNLMLNLYPLLITLSTAGNLANLAVYRHEFLRSSTTIRTLAAKAVANTLSLYCVLPNYLKSIPQLTNNPSINWFYWNSLPYTMFNTNTFATFAIWLTVIMSLERYLLVAFPIRSRNWCTMRNTYTAMILTFLGSICLQIPTILARQLFSAECLNNESQSIKIYAYTVPRKYRQLENTYYYLYSLMTIIMPMLILASTTLSINYHLFWSRKKLTCGGNVNGASMEQK